MQLELEERLKRRKDMEAELLTLTASMADVLKQGHGEATALASNVHDTATKAQQVSQRVRRLDTAQGNLTATIARIDAMTRCSACVAAVRAARQAKDWAALAERISEYQAMQPVRTSLPCACSTHDSHSVNSCGFRCSQPPVVCVGGILERLRAHIATLHAPRGCAIGPSHVQAQAEDGEADAARGDGAAAVQAAQDELLTVVRGKVRAAVEARDAGAAAALLPLYKPLKLPDEGMQAALSFVQRYRPAVY